MTMKQRIKTVQKDVEYLTNPKPQFVSIVNAGANQTPFNVLKNQEGVRTMPQEQVKKVRLKLIRKGTIPASVRKLVFDKAEFPDEATVKSYLDKHGWEGYVITTKNGKFEAAGEGVTDDNFKMLKSINCETGVTGWVGEVDLDTVDVEKTEAKENKKPGQGKDQKEGKPGKADDLPQSDEEIGTKAKGGKKNGPHANNADDLPHADEEIGTKAKKKPADDDDEDDMEKDAKKAKKKTSDTESDVDPNSPGVNEDDKTKTNTGKSKKKSLAQDGEVVRKFDQWGICFSGENSLVDVLKDGMVDGLPPGIESVFQGAYIAVANTLKSAEKGSKKKSLIQKIGTDFAEIIYAVYDTYDELLGSEKVSKSEQEYIETHEEFVKKYAKESVQSGNFGRVEKMLANVCKTLEGFGAKLETVAKDAAEAKQGVAKVNGDVSVFKNAAPTKKASGIDVADDEDTASLTKKQREDAAADVQFMQKMQRNVVGVSLLAH